VTERLCEASACIICAHMYDGAPLPACPLCGETITIDSDEVLACLRCGIPWDSDGGSAVAGVPDLRRNV
jgi:predicted amidophosphoribosyltransferase